MQKDIIFMFSGQGSQFKDMGLRYYDTNQVYHDWMDKLNVLYKEYTRHSFFDVQCGDGYEKNYKNLLYTHPGIFMVEYSMAQAFMESGIIPQYVIGSSLGEYTAATVAGGLTYENAFDIIYTQAYYITHCCVKGSMITILSSIDFYHNSELLLSNSEVVSVNFETHFTIAVTEENYEKVISYLKEQKVTYVVLPVAYPFHSTYVNNLEKVFKNNIMVENSPMQIKMCSSVTGKLVEDITPDYLWSCVREPIRFSEAITRLVSGKDCILADLGPSGTLATFAKYILKEEHFITYEPLSLFNRHFELNQIFAELKEQL